MLSHAVALCLTYEAVALLRVLCCRRQCALSGGVQYQGGTLGHRTDLVLMPQHRTLSFIRSTFDQSRS
jgi:hypothetical protein